MALDLLNEHGPKRYRDDTWKEYLRRVCYGLRDDPDVTALFSENARGETPYHQVARMIAAALLQGGQAGTHLAYAYETFLERLLVRGKQEADELALEELFATQDGRDPKVWLAAETPFLESRKDLGRNPRGIWRLDRDSALKSLTVEAAASAIASGYKGMISPNGLQLHRDRMKRFTFLLDPTNPSEEDLSAGGDSVLDMLVGTTGHDIRSSPNHMGIFARLDSLYRERDEKFGLEEEKEPRRGKEYEAIQAKLDSARKTIIDVRVYKQSFLFLSQIVL